MAMLQKKEADELKEEGIETTSIPWIKEENQFFFAEIMKFAFSFEDLYQASFIGL